MKAAIWQGPGEMTVELVDEPVAAPGRVIVAVQAAGICGSDVTSYLGKMGVSRPGQIRGHEFAGTVVAATDDDSDWLGQAVTVNPIVACGHCRACLRGEDNLCAEQASIGIQLPGGFAERVSVPVANLVALAPGVDLRAGAGAEPLAQAVHDVRLALRDRPAETALIIGAGSIGLLVVQAARLLGIPEITVLEPNSARHDAIRAEGAGTVVADRAAAEQLAAETGIGGFDAVFDIVGIASTRQDAVNWTTRGGSAVFVGLHENESPVAFRDMLRREVTIRGVNASAREDFQLAASWINSGAASLPLPPLSPLDSIGEVFAALATGQVPVGGKIVLAPGAV